jgi:acyl carrier protein
MSEQSPANLRRGTRSQELPADSGPRTSAEGLIAGIWSEILGAYDITRHHDFFDLGGNSLHALRLSIELGQAFQIELPIRVIFEHSTVASLAEWILAATQTRSYPGEEGHISTPQLEIERLPQNDVVQVAPAQEHRLPALNGLRSNGRTEPVLVFYELKGDLKPAALQQALNEMVRRHEALRMTFPLFAPLHAYVAPPGRSRWAVRQVDLWDWAESDRERVTADLLDQFSGRSFDLDHGPLVDALLVQTTEATWILGLAIGHIVFDGVSLNILVDELSVAYNSIIEGRHIRLPEFTYHFSDYARAHRLFLESPTGQKMIDYWLNQFERFGPYPPELRLKPSPQEMDPRRVGKTETIATVFDGELISKLRRVGTRRQASLHMIFLAALFMALREWTVDDRIGIALVDSGRAWKNSKGFVGFLLHGLQVWHEIPMYPSFHDILPQIREKVLEAMSNTVPLWYVARLLLTTWNSAIPCQGFSSSSKPLSRLSLTFMEPALGIMSTDASGGSSPNRFCTS